MAELIQQASILIVEDDEISQQVLTRRLRLAGFNALRAVSSGQAALDSLTEQMPDLILLDVMMPGMNGYEVTRRIREDYPDHFIPIVLISALQRPEDRIAGIEAGAIDFISKPFDSDELVARINTLLTLKQARDALDAERKRMAHLYEINRALVSHLDYPTLMSQIMTLTATLTGATRAVLILLDDGQSPSQPLHVAPDGIQLNSEAVDLLLHSGGALDGVVRHHQASVLAGVEGDPCWQMLYGDAEPLRSAAAIPLVRADVAVGLLLVTSTQPDAFDLEQLNLLTTVGSQAVIALENIRLYEQARQQRARAEALFNQTGDPVIVVDGQGNIVYINPAAERILDLDQAVLGLSLGAVFSLSMADLLLRARERGSAVSGEYTVRKGDPDQQRTYNVSISPIEDVGFMLVWQDITSIKEGERVRLESERAQTQHVLNALSRYMSPALVERVLSDPDILKRRERREALVLFADLRGFTRLTVKHTPDEVIALLNDFFAEMMEIVYQHEGVIFDIAGDELLVGFNVPYSQPDARHRALATAIAMQRQFADLKARWAARGVQTGLGIGINSGPVVLGHVGGRSRMNYAMIGQAVNIAHRLVEIAADRQIVVTPDVLSDGIPEAGGLVMLELPPQPIKGTDHPLPVIVLEMPEAPVTQAGA